MSTDSEVARPIRVGIFDRVADADVAIEELRAAGFSDQQITVVCSESTVQRHFARFEHQDPAGTYTPSAAMAGGALGAGVAGLATVGFAALAPMGGIVVLMVGGLALWTGGVVGSLVGAMMTRGVEKELANYYDQAVVRGKILVAAEQEDRARHEMLDRAAEVFAEHGLKPLPLEEG
jgi:hypothetical protein